MKSSYDDEAPPPSYAEQAYDRKISPSTTYLSQAQIAPNQWANHSPTSDFGDAVNERASAYGQQYAYRSAPVKDSAQSLPYKNAPPITPLRIVKPSEFKTYGFHVENQNSPLGPGDGASNSEPSFEINQHQIPQPQSVDHHTIHPQSEQRISTGELSQRSPTFGSYGAASAPMSQYPPQPQTPRRPLPPRPSQQHQSYGATHPAMSPHPSQPGYTNFDPSTAYARSPAHSSPVNALALYNSAVSAQMTVPRGNIQRHPVSSRSHSNDFSPSRMRPGSIYSVASSHTSADDSDRYSEYSHHSSANSTYNNRSTTSDNPWYPNRR